MDHKNAYKTRSYIIFMGKPYFEEREQETFYLDLPDTIRQSLESTLTHLYDAGEARKRFLDVVPAVDVFKRVEDIAIAITNNIPPLPEEINNTDQKFQNYNTWNPTKPYDGLDIICLCNPREEETYRKILDEYQIQAAEKKVSPCSIKNCTLIEDALAIPLCKTDTLTPDEGGFEETTIIPELIVLFSKNQIYRRFVKTDTYNQAHIKSDIFWKTINTCERHATKESLIKEFDKSASQVFGEHIFPKTQEERKKFRISRNYYLRPDHGDAPTIDM